MSQQQSQDHPHDTMDVDQGQPHRAQTLYALTTGSLASSVSKLSGSFRGLPSDKDFHFYYNFADFKIPIQEISKKSQSMIEAIGLSTVPLWGAKDMVFPASGDMDDGYDWLVNMNDELLERFDVSADEFQKVRKKEEETGQAETNMEDGFQLVYGRKKGGNHGSASQSSVGAEASVVTGVKVATKDKKTMGPKPKVPFHIPSIRKPQEEFSILVNNTNQPFEHVWLQRSEDGLRFIHPLEKLLVLDFVDEDIENLNPIKPPLLESAPFKLVEELKDLKELAAKLRGVQEFAVDLEHNQYRSFQGLTCLMQISTRTEDFVVDTLKLRVHVGPYLREVFKDPSKKKVMHGADRDIVWLQRDFGIYVCNLFDTGQASKVLKLERNSLEFLLHHLCGVTANKEYQNADWRLRPLPEEMLRYAREDTHYLLYIYDLMRIKLFSMPKESENCDAPLLEVYKRSYDVCMQLYEKELLTEDSYLYIYGLQAATLDASQLAVAAGLCQWRDVVARTEDESTGYVLPNKILLEIAKQKPDSISKLRRLVKSKHPFVEHNLASIVSIIRHSIENAAEFESVAEQLKMGRIGTVAEENIVVTDGSEVFLPDTSTEAGVANARRESTDGGDAISGHVSLLFTDSSKPKPYSLETGCTASEQCSELPCSSITPSEQSRDANDNTLQLNSTKVTGATVQMLKKPSRAFGALLGSSAPKRKFGTDKKEEMKLEQIRCSVNLPFHSFSGRSEQSKPVTGVPDTAAKIGNPQGSVSMPAASSKMDDIILLENNSNAEEPEPGNSEATDEHKNNAGMSALESDNEDEPMTLSELSSSFEKCFGSLNQKGEARQAEKSQESGFLQVKPFDYDAARKQVRFGEEEQSGSGSGEKGLRNTNDCRGKKKGSATGRGQRDDGTSEQLPQGRRRQAFPATGNRSATFRGV